MKPLRHPTNAAVPQGPETLVSKDWLTFVRIVTTIWMTLCGLLMLAALAWFPYGLFLTGAFAWFAVWLFSRLRGPRFKEGLAGAIGAGGAIAILMTTVVVAVLYSGDERNWQAYAMAVLLVLLSAILPVAGIRTYYTTKPEPTDETLTRALALGMLFLVMIGVPVGFGVSNFLLDHGKAHQATAVADLRAINAAEIVYAERYNAGYSPTLVALGDPAGGAQPSASGAGLVESSLASGMRAGYEITYTPGS